MFFKLPFLESKCQKTKYSQAHDKELAVYLQNHYTERTWLLNLGKSQK